MKGRGFKELSLLHRKQVSAAFRMFIQRSFPVILVFMSIFRTGYCQDRILFNIDIKSPLKLSIERNIRNKKFINYIKDERETDLMHNSKYEKSGSQVFSIKRNADAENIIDVNYKAGYLREIEEFYSTNSFYQSLKLIKRFSDVFQLTLNPAIEYAKRQEDGLPDVNKWYDNTGLKAEFDFNAYNTLSVFGAGSISDSTWTAYGTSLRSLIELDEVQIRNFFIASYEYFYYWNEVGQDFVNDNVNIKYNNFSLNAGYFYGVVDKNYIEDYTAVAKNPNTSINLELLYSISSAPNINIGIQYYTKNFKYHSPLYYSPQDRKITGATSSFYNMFGKYYLYFGAGAAVDNNDVFIWNIDSEAGYDSDDISVSLGLSRYNDPYYTNYNTFLNIFKRF